MLKNRFTPVQVFCLKSGKISKIQNSFEFMFIIREYWAFHFSILEKKLIIKL